jgi:hypothetical protein
LGDAGAVSHRYANNDRGSGAFGTDDPGNELSKKGVHVIDLTHTVDYVYMLLIAAGVGAVGGLGAELVMNRAESSGTLALPGSTKDKAIWRMGFPASLIVGAIAAVAVLYFFPPVVEKIVTGTNGAPAKTVNQYELAKLVPLALIVGSAGPAFLSTAQSRLMSALNAQKAEAVAETAKSQVDQIATSAAATVGPAVHAAVAQHLPSAGAAVVDQVADAVAATMETTLKSQVEHAQDQVDAIAPSATESN